MKRLVSILGSILLLKACAAQVDSLQVAKVNCPKPTTVYLETPTTNQGFYERFDYHIRNIVADASTIKFQTLKNDFVYCRTNNTWIVQPGTLKSELLPPKNYVEITKNIVNPPLKTIELDGKKYQYRVAIEPKFISGENGELSRPSVAPENDKIVFELIAPESKNPQKQTIYTLKDLQQAAVKSDYSSGGSLGIPRITAAVTHGNKIWWAIAFEQGEGNNGLGTILGYDPQPNQFTVIQPQELWWQQITDLAITGDPNNPTFWMGTNVSGEGNFYLPAKGLIAYRPDSQNPNSGSLTSYTVNNSPLVGAIPDKLKLAADTLWISTGNGVCKLNWQAADNPGSWLCWRFALMATPSAELPFYSSSTNKKPAVTLPATSNVEVLWWSPIDLQTRKGRYEVRYPQGFTVKLDQGASLEPSNRLVSAGKPPVFWSGFEWHWNGKRFVRGFDEVANNEFGGGPQGIGSNRSDPNLPSNWNAMRGDLDLLNLSAKSTSVRYYSGWVDEDKLQPYLTVVPQEKVQNPQPNPLEAIATQLPKE